MPPVRTTMPAAKPVKTERTHEENQERAYIAASRRSDRSLEARVESARRASEIHKRRTGRSLKVTEQDVVNEEMYEEEDDDLPMQYRRLTAHLQTTNADFDRRLAAYLTNHVAMRTALGQAVSDSYAQQYPNTPQFANQLQQQAQPHAFAAQPQNQNSMCPPHAPNRSPQMYRQSPYPMSHAQHGFRPQAHNRSASIATPQELHGYSNNLSNQGTPVDNIKMEDRRMSLPAQGFPSTPGGQSVTPPGNTSPTASRTHSSSNLANLKLEAARQGLSSGPQSSSIKLEQPQTPMGFSANGLRPSSFPSALDMSGGFDGSSSNMGFNPFSTTLPTESQQLLGGTLDPNDPLTAMLMGGESRPMQPFYSYNPNGSSKKSFSGPSAYEGMSQTLAPGVLDTSMPQMGGFGSPTSATSDSVISPYTPHGFSGGLDSSYSYAFKPSNFISSESTSGQISPNVDRDWSSLIDNNVWEEQTSSQSAAV